ncbi:hypothetical protein Micbo1qcDRAFT_164835 [Microdochium bolleyi]|uniref:Uncharacterized protein n=1 Tax=Microdochium bolleyi TaxID=196109 RepID=A0A136IZF1_9PEZI|nr:hypothetical protein Micbo1qcDRAFT_164835 [Microdochium bolleyi]
MGSYTGRSSMMSPGSSSGAWMVMPMIFWTWAVCPATASVMLISSRCDCRMLMVLKVVETWLVAGRSRNVVQALEAPKGSSTAGLPLLVEMQVVVTACGLLRMCVGARAWTTEMSLMV